MYYWWCTSNELSSREKWSSISFLTLSCIEFKARCHFFLELGKTLISCHILRKMHKSDNQIKLHRGIFCRWENKIKTSKVQSIVIFQLCDWIFIILLKVSNGLKIIHNPSVELFHIWTDTDQIQYLSLLSDTQKVKLGFCLKTFAVQI